MHGEKSKEFLWHMDTMMKQEIKLRDILDWNQLLGMSKAQQVEFGVENLLGIYCGSKWTVYNLRFKRTLCCGIVGSKTPLS